MGLPLVELDERHGRLLGVDPLVKDAGEDQARVRVRAPPQPHPEPPLVGRLRTPGGG